MYSLNNFDLHPQPCCFIFYSVTAPPPPVGQGLLFIQTSLSLRNTTLGMTPLDEGSARCRDLCLTTHNSHKRRASLHPVGIRTRNPSRRAAENPHALDRAATGIGHHVTLYFTKIRCILKNILPHTHTHTHTHTHNFSVLRWRTKCHTQSQNLYGRHTSTHHHHHHQQQQQ